MVLTLKRTNAFVPAVARSFYAQRRVVRRRRVALQPD